MQALHCSVENAPKFLTWIHERGGVAVWPSVNLSNPGGSWSTPATTNGQPTGKPTWEAANEPERVVTDPCDVVVTTPREVKRFHVAVRRGGFMFKLTDASSRKVRVAVERAGAGAWYVFDYGSQEAVILVPDREVTLAEYAKEGGSSCADNG